MIELWDSNLKKYADRDWLVNRLTGHQCGCGKFVVAWLLKLDPWWWCDEELRRGRGLHLGDSDAARTAMEVMFPYRYVLPLYFLAVALMESSCPFLDWAIRIWLIQNLPNFKISYEFLICMICVSPLCKIWQDQEDPISGIGSFHDILDPSPPVLQTVSAFMMLVLKKQ